MPLRCFDAQGQSIHSYDLSDSEWDSLEVANRKSRDLRMACCSSQVILKRSALGTRFFAHKSATGCTTGDETREHLHLKGLAIEAARACGWDAEAEVFDVSPVGEPWRADVLARRGKHAVAVEIQWSGQTSSETLERQRRYAQSGIRGLWLLRQPGFPITKELPAVCVGGSLGEGFMALIPAHQRMRARDRGDPKLWHRSLPMDDFLRAVFQRRFQFGLPSEAHADVVVKIAPALCWHEPCRTITWIVTGIVVAFPHKEVSFSVAELGDYPDLLKTVLDRLPPDSEVGSIKRRYSRTQGRSYFSNGCGKCDRVFGEFMLAYDPSEEMELVRFPIEVTRRWEQAVRSHDEYEEDSPTWNVISDLSLG